MCKNWNIHIFFLSLKHRSNLIISGGHNMKTEDSLNVLQQAGMQILQNHKFQHSVQNLGKAVLQGGAAVGSATGAALIGSGTTASIGTAAASAGATISGAASAAGSALLAAAASPVVIGCAIVGAGILVGVGIKKLFE